CVVVCGHVRVPVKIQRHLSSGRSCVVLQRSAFDVVQPRPCQLPAAHHCPADDMHGHPHHGPICLLTWRRLRPGSFHVPPDLGRTCSADRRHPAHCRAGATGATADLRCVLSRRFRRALSGIEHPGRTTHPSVLCVFHHRGRTLC